MPDPVLTPEEIAARMSASEGSFAGDGGEGGSAGGAGGDGGSGGGAPTFTPSPIWDYYKAKLPEDKRNEFKLPENLSAETEQQLLDEHLTGIYSKKPTLDNLHPLAREIQEYAGSVDNFDAVEFMKSKVGEMTHAGKTDDDLVYEAYAAKLLKTEANPYGKTEEEIKEMLKSVNPLEKSTIAIEMRKKIDMEAKNRYNNPEASAQNRAKMQELYIQNTTKFIDEKFKPEQQRGDKAVEARSIAGIDIGEANFQAFKEDFKAMVMPDKDGVIPLAVKLQNDDAIFEFAMYQAFKDEIRKAMVKSKNEGKMFMLDQLPKEPGGNTGGGRAPAAGTYTDTEMSDRMSKPEGTY